MAVADVAVTMGPRTTRRLTAGAIVVGMLATAGVGLFLLVGRANHSGSASSTGLAHATPTFVTQKIVYGMTKAQVLRHIGKPAKTVGPCWQYNENEVIRDGENFLNAERVCFLGDVYSYDYSEIDGTWNYPTTPLVVPKNLG